MIRGWYRGGPTAVLQGSLDELSGGLGLQRLCGENPWTVGERVISGYLAAFGRQP